MNLAAVTLKEETLEEDQKQCYIQCKQKTDQLQCEHTELPLTESEHWPI